MFVDTTAIFPVGRCAKNGEDVAPISEMDCFPKTFAVIPDEEAQLLLF